MEFGKKCNKIREKLETALIALVGFSLIFFAARYDVSAIVSYPPSASLVAGDITSTLIKDGTIQGIDIDKGTNASTTGFSVANFWATSTISLPAGSITTGYILDGTIGDLDISSSTLIQYGKLSLTGNIVNADISASAAIADSKLATISTTGKVSGAALTSLNTIPSGAGVIPSANLPASSVARATLVFGEDVNLGQAVYIATTTVASSSIAFTGTTRDHSIFGSPAVGTATSAQQVMLYSRMDTFSVLLKYNTALPIGNVKCGLQSVSGGNPSGTYLASATIPNTSITTTYATTTFVIPMQSNLYNAQRYFVCESTAAETGTGYYALSMIAGNPYSGGTAKKFASGAWANESVGEYDWDLTYNEPSVQGQVYRASATSTTYSEVLGLAAATTTAGSSGNIDISGVSNATSTMTAGQIYYLHNEWGSWGATAGTNQKTIGIAASSTAIILRIN